MSITETIARAIADGLKSNSVYVSDDLRKCIVDGGLFDLHDLAAPIITALTEAGHAIVPVEPSEAMLETGLFEAESCTNDWTASAACLPGHVWKSMVRASNFSPLDSEKGE